MKASIIIPVFNGERYLRACLESVLAQDHQDCEVVVVDDGSTDRSLEIASSFESDRVRVCQQPNSGPSAARNLGLTLCSADSSCVFFVDCDDCIACDYVSTLLANFSKDIATLPVCEMAVLGEDAPVPSYILAEPKPIVSYLNYWHNAEFLERFAKGLMNSSCNKCYSLAIIREKGLRFSEGYPEDTAFNLEYLNHIDKIAYIPRKLYFYIKRGGSVTGRPYPELYDGYISIQHQLYARIPVKLHSYVHEFVYPQYLGNTRRFMRAGDFKTPPQTKRS